MSKLKPVHGNVIEFNQPDVLIPPRPNIPQTVEDNVRKDERRRLVEHIHNMLDSDDAWDDGIEIHPSFLYGYAPNGETLVHLDRILEWLKKQ